MFVKTLFWFFLLWFDFYCKRWRLVAMFWYIFNFNWTVNVIMKICAPHFLKTSEVHWKHKECQESFTGYSYYGNVHRKPPCPHDRICRQNHPIKLGHLIFSYIPIFQSIQSWVSFKHGIMYKKQNLQPFLWYVLFDNIFCLFKATNWKHKITRGFKSRLGNKWHKLLYIVSIFV